MEWPRALYELDRGLGLAVCVAHKGTHIWYLDGCHALPARRAPFSDPLPRCQEDGSCRLAAGTHVHAPPTKIEIDVDGLAEAIIRASRAAREEHRPPPPAPSSSSRPATDLSSVLDSYRE